MVARNSIFLGVYEIIKKVQHFHETIVGMEKLK